MKISSMDGIETIKFEKFTDLRGEFSRIFEKRLVPELGPGFEIVEMSISKNYSAGTVRGLHMLSSDYGEEKVIVCLSGEILDVVVDMRPSSSTYLSHLTISLNDYEARALYIPPGFAHGFQTLANQTNVLYCMSRNYDQNLEIGFKFDDPKLEIQWPLAVAAISEKDSRWPSI